MKKAANEQEFLDLIKRYESITLEEIKTSVKLEGDYAFAYDQVKTDLTGFGCTADCTLCRKASVEAGWSSCRMCDVCVWKMAYSVDAVIDYSCCTGEPKITYDGINDADTPEDLLMGYRDRAEFMKNAWKKYKKLAKTE
jgi:hypothetical protein